MKEGRSQMTPQTAWEVKRRLYLPDMVSEDDAASAMQCLEHLDGLLGVRAEVRRRRLTLVYDLLQLDYRTLLEALRRAGYPAPDTRWSRLKANWFQSVDETGRQNARIPASPCCSRPPPQPNRLKP